MVLLRKALAGIVLPVLTGPRRVTADKAADLSTRNREFPITQSQANVANMRINLWRRLLVPLSALMLLSSAPAQAQFVSCSPTSATLLSSLVSGCTIDDKLFANFSARVGLTDVSAFLTLTSIQDGDLLREGFFLGLPLALPVGVSAGVPLLIGYSVTVLDPLFLITDIHLGLTGSTTGTVTETVTSGLDVLAVLQVGTNPLGGSFGNTADAFFQGVNSLVVLKEITDIDVFTGGGQIQQEVTQAPVPEPGSLALIFLAVAGLAATRRRKNV